MKYLIRSLSKTIDPFIWKLAEKHQAILAGGTFERLSNNEKINDLDLYFRTPVQAYKFCQDLRNNYNCVGTTKRSILFKNSSKEIPINVIIFKYFQDAKEILHYFDFECCKASFDFHTKEFYASPEYLLSIQTKQLIYSRSLFPIGALIRLQKYVKRGYTIDYASLLRLYKDLKNLDITNPEVLESHIGGMYGTICDLKGLTLDEMIQKIDDTILYEKKGEYITLDDNKLEKLFPDLWEKFTLSIKEEKKNNLHKNCICQSCLKEFSKSTNYTLFRYKGDIQYSEIILNDETDSNITTEILPVTFPIIVSKKIKYVSEKEGYSTYRNSFKYYSNQFVNDYDHGIYVGLNENDLTYDGDAICTIRIDKPEDIIAKQNDNTLRISKGYVLSIKPLQQKVNDIFK
jgi:hypothetical protein